MYTSKTLNILGHILIILACVKDSFFENCVHFHIINNNLFFFAEILRTVCSKSWWLNNLSSRKFEQVHDRCCALFLGLKNCLCTVFFFFNLKPIPCFFTYKPSDFFSICDKNLVDFFTGNGVRLIAEGLGFKTNTNCWITLPSRL